MRVVAFNGSPRKEGNTGHLLRHVLALLKEEGIRTEPGPGRRKRRSMDARPAGNVLRARMAGA